MAKATWGDIYKELGVQPVINAIGSVTLLGGSTPIPEVKEAMDRAESAYVPLMELEEKAGDAIANMVNVPAAYITSGAGSALTLAAAAVMAGENDAKIEQLPNTAGMKNQILIQKLQRYWYDRCLEASGATLVDYGSAYGTTAEDLEKAIGPKTAAVHFLAVEQDPDPNILSLEVIIKIAKSHDLPVIVDAAGQIYPLDNFGKYVRMGADFQCIAAKYLGASQSVGLALGSTEFIRKLSLQSFVGYEGRRIRGIGRPHKVDRQEMVGAVAAVRHWMTMNHEDRLATSETKSRTVLASLAGVTGLKANIIDNVIGHLAFGVKLDLDNKATGKTAHDLVTALKEGNPPVWTRVREGEDCIVIHVFGLNEGEAEVVGQRIAGVVKGWTGG